eukprot:2236022-Amphidinium_carterae.3
MWDCGFWVPVWDTDHLEYEMYVPSWPPGLVERIALNNAPKYAKAGGDVSMLDVTDMLKTWHQTLRRQDMKAVTFPLRVSRTILTVWGRSVLQDAGHEGDVIELPSSGSPLLSMSNAQTGENQQPLPQPAKATAAGTPARHTDVTVQQMQFTAQVFNVQDALPQPAAVTAAGRQTTAGVQQGQPSRRQTYCDYRRIP